MARKACEWKNGRRCNLADCPVTKADCNECADYKALEEHAETVLEHLANKMSSSDAAELLISKVHELGFADVLAVWLRSSWEESDGTS